LIQQYTFSVQTVPIWDAGIAAEMHKLTGHSDDAIGLALHPDGKRLLTGGGSKDKALRVWDIDTGKELA